MDSRLESLGLSSIDVEMDWASFREIIYATAIEVLVTTMFKHWDWFYENYTFKNCLKGKPIPTEPF